MQKENFEFLGGRVGYGGVGINKTVGSNYEQKFAIDRGDIIHAHAPSEVDFKFSKPVYIQGGFNQDVNPQRDVSFYVNGDCVGCFADNKFLTRTKKVEGECTLEARTGNAACSHVIWRVVQASEIKPKKIGVCSCLFRSTDTKEFIEKEYKNNNVDGVKFYIDCDKKESDVAVRVNGQIQEAINDGCDVIIVVDPGVVLTDFFIESLTTENEYVVEGLSQGVSLESYDNKKYEIMYSGNGSPSVIAATPQKWVELGGLKLLDKSICENIKNITENASIVVKYNQVFPLVVFEDGNKPVQITSISPYSPLQERVKQAKKNTDNINEETETEKPKAEKPKRKVKKDEKADLAD